MATEFSNGADPVANLPKSATSVMQAITLMTLFAGGYVGKDAYEEIRTQLTESRVEQAELRKSIEAVAAQVGESRDERLTLRLRVDALTERVATLEAGGRRGRRR